MRQLALEEGKIVYMAVPRLRSERPFVRLDPAKLHGRAREASTIEGAVGLGKPVTLDEMDEIDLVVCGSVAANLNGERVGKGGGYSDLEFALLRQKERIRDWTPILTVIHPQQIIGRKIPMTVHDIHLDYILTPEKAFHIPRVCGNPAAIHWDLIDKEKIEAIPALKRLWTGRSHPPLHRKIDNTRQGK